MRAKAENTPAKVADPASSRPQTESSAYRLAYLDPDFLSREETRAVRLQLELAKPDLKLREMGIDATVVVFGSARLSADSPYYEEARKFGRLMSRRRLGPSGQRVTVVTGGGGGIMEAANRGAAEAGAPSVGMNIVLPHEQQPNPYITPTLCFQFHYFAIRKMHLLMRARALAAFPGGFGTCDELFEVLTLIQTGKIEPLPVVLIGRRFWRLVVNFDAMFDGGMISRDDLKLFTVVDTAEQACRAIARFYRERPALAQATKRDV